MTTEEVPSTIVAPTQVATGVDRLTSKLKNKEDLVQLITIILTELQASSDALIGLKDIKDLDTVTGIWLDYLGKAIGLSRDGREDEPYRTALKLKIKVNRADGTPPVIYEIVKEYTDSESVRIAEGLLSYGQVIFDGDTNVDNSLWRLVQEIKPACTNLVLVQNTDKSCFFPAYEWVDLTTNQFNITTDTVDSVLQFDDGVLSLGDDVLTFVTGAGDAAPFNIKVYSGIDASPFNLSTESTVTGYDPDTTGHNVPEWEEPTGFTFSNGSSFLIKVSEDEDPKPLVYTSYSTKQNSVLLPWEITSESDPNASLDTLRAYYGGDANCRTLFTSLTEVVENLPLYDPLDELRYYYLGDDNCRTMFDSLLDTVRNLPE